MTADQLVFTPFYLIGFFIYTGNVNKSSGKGFKRGIELQRKDLVDLDEKLDDMTDRYDS
jgi:hypothetical protein